jgi:hypothetical protein
MLGIYTIDCGVPESVVFDRGLRYRTSHRIGSGHVVCLVLSRKERIECSVELETVSRRMDELSSKLQSAMMKAMPHLMDPQVQQAMTAQAQAMAQAGK